MADDSESGQTIDSMRKQLELVMSKLEAAESQISALIKKEEENNRMLSTMMETLQQMGLVSQPYKKTEQKTGKDEDRAYG